MFVCVCSEHRQNLADLTRNLQRALAWDFVRLRMHSRLELDSVKCECVWCDGSKECMATTHGSHIKLVDYTQSRVL